MAGSVNKVILVGNLGKDPEIRRTQDGRPIANLRIATSKSWRDKATGERREKTEWHSVVIFNENLCKIAEQYLKKGAKVFIEGALQTRKWQGQDGQDRYSTEVVLQGFNGNLTMLDGRSGRRHVGRRPGRLRRRRQRLRGCPARGAQRRRRWRQERRRQLRQAARRRDPVLTSHANFSPTRHCPGASPPGHFFATVRRATSPRETRPTHVSPFGCGGLGAATWP